MTCLAWKCKPKVHGIYWVKSVSWTYYGKSIRKFGFNVLSCYLWQSWCSQTRHSLSQIKNIFLGWTVVLNSNYFTAILDLEHIHTHLIEILRGGGSQKPKIFKESTKLNSTGISRGLGVGVKPNNLPWGGCGYFLEHSHCNLQSHFSLSLFHTFSFSPQIFEVWFCCIIKKYTRS